MVNNDYIDQLIINFIEEFIETLSCWLKSSFEKILFASTKRSSGIEYGFEWLIHRGLAYYLLFKQEQKQILSLKIGEKDAYTGFKYDISFQYNSSRIIIEIKTTARANFSFVYSDLHKYFPEDSNVYFLVFSYPVHKLNFDIEAKKLGTT